MARAGWGLIAAGMVAGCGSEEVTRYDPIEGPEWTLTVVEPDHGSEIASPHPVEVVITGPAVVRGERRDFDIGIYVDDVLAKRSREERVEIELAPGRRTLRVEGLDAFGLRSDVRGDTIRVEVLGDLPGRAGTDGKAESNGEEAKP